VPKECAHWIIARRVAASYPGPKIKTLLARWEPLYLLGSVLPDTAFYTLGGRNRRRLLELAETLHGSRGGDPLFFLERVVSGPDPVLVSLALGVVCHIMTDSQFHPIVYHFCGIDEAHPGALQRHLRFEAWLDVHYRSLEPPPAGGRLARILRAAPMPLRRVAAAARELLFDPSLSARAVAAAVNRQAQRQRLLYNPALRRAIAGLRRVRRVAGGTIAALLDPASDGPVPFFSRPISYRRPADGVSRTETLADIEARVAGLMHQAFDVFESDVSRRKAAAALPRLSAETGGPPSARPRVSLMRHFAIADVDTLLGVGGARTRHRR